jgi:uncharacterized membrane protein
MTDIQIFQFMGIAFFAMGMGMLTNPKFIKGITEDLLDSTANLLFSGLFCLAIGFPLVTFHNVWILNSSLIITLLGWLALAKGLAFLMFPVQTANLYKGILIKENKAYISYAVVAMGIIFLYLGYLA